jgi:predicted RNA-binding protein with PIN domain
VGKGRGRGTPLPHKSRLYLFDGYNLLHAGGFVQPQELVDRLAGFVALRGAQGIVVFDGDGADAVYGALKVRFAPTADHLLERLAAEHRDQVEVILVSTDRAVRATAGLDVRKVLSEEFVTGLRPARETREKPPGGKVEDALEEETRRRLEKWRRRRA